MADVAEATQSGDLITNITDDDNFVNISTIERQPAQGADTSETAYVFADDNLPEALKQTA